MKELVRSIKGELPVAKEWGVNIDKRKFQEKLNTWNKKPDVDKADDCATAGMVAIGIGAGLMALSMIFSKRGEKNEQKKKIR